MFRAALIGLIRLYQVWISPWTPAACRYTPTCSAYAIQALRLHGAGWGSWLAFRRLMRCHPWGGHGYDPVPRPHAAGLAADHTQAGSVEGHRALGGMDGRATSDRHTSKVSE
jgi:hypothetical protein